MPYINQTEIFGKNEAGGNTRAKVSTTGHLFTDGYIVDQNGNAIAIDTITRQLVVIQNGHHEIHEGDHYFIKTWLRDDGVGGSTTFFAFTTPNTTTRIHAKAILGELKK